MELKACPFCGSNPADVGMNIPYTFHSGTCYFINRHCGDGEIVGILWNTRPIEDELQRKLDDIRDILQKMDNWCNAYPIDIFPEPDLIKARDVLEFARMSLDSISASAMRHVVNGMRDYVQEALKKLEE